MGYSNGKKDAGEPSQCNEMRQFHLMVIPKENIESLQSSYRNHPIRKHENLNGIICIILLGHRIHELKDINEFAQITRLSTLQNFLCVGKKEKTNKSKKHAYVLDKPHFICHHIFLSFSFICPCFIIVPFQWSSEVLEENYL